ncbi:hypothetical protein B0T16DRAFT_440445 [Cercophora newfieldiana]|uniref:Uncharacterized protein n=1 Tax=Cercophora newfieldiana TaxID=92897 RepID=A0AA39YM24_9PEZI|nr:hypothetical protein B0T16DRAFT_440445 [Cercophora newfieldiana]
MQSRPLMMRMKIALIEITGVNGRPNPNNGGIFIALDAASRGKIENAVIKVFNDSWRCQDILSTDGAPSGWNLEVQLTKTVEALVWASLELRHYGCEVELHYIPGIGMRYTRTKLLTMSQKICGQVARRPKHADTAPHEMSSNVDPFGCVDSRKNSLPSLLIPQNPLEYRKPQTPLSR